MTDRFDLQAHLRNVYVDALILSGGGDFNPLYGGEEPSNRLHDINSERDLPELILTQMAYNRQMPILGICRGIQTLAMALGGRVWQDINEKTVTKHSQQAARSEVTHSVNIEEDSLLYQMYQENKMFVNSFHHQAVRETGPKFRVTAKSPDNIIEAMESNEYKPIVGVQWHPECLEEGMPLFHWLIKEALAYHHAHEVHNRVLTLDTHCDTPMFFPQGIHFDQRDPKILVDLHKMNEGRQDATIMVAYLPQPKIGETFSSLVDFDVPGPTEYADLIFDKIEEIVNKAYLSIARTPGDLYEDKRNHRKSIMLGIENGLALNGQLQNLQHFAQRGIVYMTLCHNGDNDICDSARGCNTHGGVSRFGEQVIREMNRLGIMVDLSHASEKSFYDALDISSTPIVCSHSSCKALCDHPRNLTDDQMRALASKGGVAQTTLYSGFLKSEGEGVRLSWRAVEGAQKYRAYYKGKNGWVRMGETASAEFVDDVVSVGSTYTYTVRCVDKEGDFTSNYNKNGWKHTYTGIAAPQITNLSEDANGVKIKWGSVQGAAKYRVYSKNSSGGWDRIGETSSPEYLDSTVTSGNTYTYTVRCVNSKGCFVSDYDHNGRSCRFNGIPAPIITKIDSEAEGLRISWNAVAGAAKYRVYYKNSRGGWSVLGETPETEILDSVVTAGHSYTYTVRCLGSGGRLISGYDATGRTGTYKGVETPRITSLENTASGVRISWNPVEGAKHYRVFYKGKNGWARLGDTNGASYTDTNVRDGGTYTYTVRCVGEHDNFISSFDAKGSTIQYKK